MDALKDAYRLVLVDGPGHGKSDRPSETFVVEDCVPAALDVLDAAGVQRAAVVGISWGGVVAMHLALRAPERVSGIALFDTSADDETRMARIQNGVLARIARRYGLIWPLDQYAVASLFSPKFPRRRPDICGKLLADIQAADRESMYRMLIALLKRPSIIDEIKSIRIPALVVTGAKDRLDPPIHGERIAQRIPGARFEQLPGVGHLSTMEAPDEVNRLLREFLPAATGSHS